MIVATESGKVAGSTRDGVARYLGIPYAAAPYGENRFRLPQPHPPWHETRDALEYGPTPPQAPYAEGLTDILPTVLVQGDEVLNLNIWAPEGASAEPGGHPVLVWIHGGGLTRGCNALETYDGQAFARDGVILVSINYRLGAEGFSVLPDAPANLGLADQVAALGWISRNIGAFGGDPAQVTVFGQSAGAACVAALCASPAAAGLFSGAVLQSGPITVPPSTSARRATRLVARDLGIPATRAALKDVPAQQLLGAQLRVTEGRSIIAGGPAFGLVVDGDLVPVDPMMALTTGTAEEIPMMLGYTTEEYRLWFLPTRVIDKLNRLHLVAARLKLKVPARAVRRYQRNRPAAQPGEIVGMLATDGLLRVPKNQVADARGTTTWLYEFAWPSPVHDLRAAHGLELAFVFDNLDGDEARAFTGPHAPQQLATTMHDAWVRFARHRDPGWESWDEARPVMVFDHPVSQVVHAPREDERRALAR